MWERKESLLGAEALQIVIKIGGLFLIVKNEKMILMMQTIHNRTKHRIEAAGYPFQLNQCRFIRLYGLGNRLYDTILFIKFD